MGSLEIRTTLTSVAAVRSSPGLEKHRMADVLQTLRLHDGWSTDIDKEKYSKALQEVHNRNSQWNFTRNGLL